MRAIVEKLEQSYEVTLHFLKLGKSYGVKKWSGQSEKLTARLKTGKNGRQLTSAKSSRFLFLALSFIEKLRSSGNSKYLKKGVKLRMTAGHELKGCHGSNTTYTGSLNLNALCFQINRNSIYSIYIYIQFIFSLLAWLMKRT